MLANGHLAGAVRVETQRGDRALDQLAAGHPRGQSGFLERGIDGFPDRLVRYPVADPAEPRHDSDRL